VAVVQAPGFAIAGERLGLAKSAVSRGIQELEDRLGSRLLHRTTRRLSLTEAGTEFYQRSLKILADLQEAEDVASKGTSEHAPIRLSIRGRCLVWSGQSQLYLI
jgi:DNA-binding transcriptional LysR family regulator